ncbi:DNA topoisomerase III [Ascodesmis nigricans]|uniref:DNA topoisomerase n=1 Tax=Ascodesmis nigricans TaxID=341454 RepID=A0A4S2N2J4_9PEZI|nr:DNA topoisomerase III [Ascodesmis nigricans]
MPNKILCVAEKPSIARAVAGHLSGGQQSVVSFAPLDISIFVKNFDFHYNFPPPWGSCQVTMTSVIGHTVEWDFTKDYQKWNSCEPHHLFDAPTEKTVGDRKDIAENIKTEARCSRALFIWTDCDREGEYIGTEVRDIARTVNPNIEVKRARFSNIERAHILRAAQHPVELDERQAQAVAARIELDLRIGAAFTRWQTKLLQSIEGLEQKVISYGSCQFPTLGFVVDRYRRVKNFVPEQFWSIKVMHKRDDINVTFNWDRNRLFDRMMVIVLFEKCLQAKKARVTKVQKKPTKKWKPLPLTTVELQKLGSRFLHITSQEVMSIAEKLYTNGFISYPRTETDQFDPGMDLRALCEKQTQSPTWGPFAQNLLNGAFESPRNGRNNDKAHPPIHPVTYVTPNALANQNERRVYEFIARRFLACCSSDAVGEQSTVDIQYGPEGFHASGLRVIARNYLDVYVYDKWESSQPLPQFIEGEEFVPTEANITDGKTTPPGFLTEPELIALMDANGIGTDATMADHIAKIKDRGYVFTRVRAGGDQQASGMEEFAPSNLGSALVEGYDQIGFENSVSKPFLRKEMEEKMKKICEGQMERHDVVHSTIEQYREMFLRAKQQSRLLKDITSRYLTDDGV